MMAMAMAMASVLFSAGQGPKRALRSGAIAPAHRSHPRSHPGLGLTARAFPSAYARAAGPTQV